MIIGQWYKFVPFGLTFSAFFLSFTISSRLGIVPPSQPIFERLTHSEQRTNKDVLGLGIESMTLCIRVSFSILFWIQ